MRSSLASRRRAAPGDAPAAPATPGVYVTPTTLAALEGQARQLVFRPRHPTHNLLAGRHGSRVRGRGLDFEELRPYLPGDDVRTIDWHVTARMPKPFIRIYTEEKDRPVLVIVDQRINMFFGTQMALKSVIAAETAALCLWRALADGDRVGGIVFDDATIDSHRPERNRGSLLRLLGLIADRNRALHAGAAVQRAPAQFDAALDQAARSAERDHLVIIVTDCDGNGPRTRNLLRRLAIRNDVVLFMVHDPFLHQLPEGPQLVASDGELQMEIPSGAARARKSIAEAAGHGLATILGWRREIGISVAPLTTAHDAASQLRRIIGSQGGRA